MAGARLSLARPEILSFRRVSGGLDERLPPGPESLRRAAWAGLQDSMPRAALLSIHARVEGTGPSAWEDPSLAQLWGPHYSVFVVAARDLAVFSLGTLPDDARGRQRAEDLAARGGAAAFEALGESLTPVKTPPAATRCGLRGSGPAPCSSGERSPGRGGVRARS